MQKSPPTITTAELHRLVVRAEPLWLIYVPDDSSPAPGHIPGSLATRDEGLVAALAGDTPMVLYGDDAHAERARALAARSAREGKQARWYAGGLKAWAVAGHPIEFA